MTYAQTNDIDLGLDLGGVDATDNFSPVPAGDYTVQAVEVDLTQSGAGNNMIKTQFEITDGEYAGRKVFENFNIEHPNHTTVEIALKGIKQWAMACGLTGNERLTLGLLKGLEGVEFIGRLAIEKDKTGMYGDRNRIRSYHALDGGRPAAAPPAPAAQPTPARAAATAGNKRPWEK